MSIFDRIPSDFEYLHVTSSGHRELLRLPCLTPECVKAAAAMIATADFTADPCK